MDDGGQRATRGQRATPEQRATPGQRATLRQRDYRAAGHRWETILTAIGRSLAEGSIGNTSLWLDFIILINEEVLNALHKIRSAHASRACQCY